jgi:hypothetical protein
MKWGFKMSSVNYQAYSAKAGVLSTGLKFGVNEMVETGFSMGLQNGRRIVIDSVAGDVENEFVKDMIQDGLSAGMGFFTGKLMQKQEELLDSAFSKGVTLVGSWYTKSLLKNKLRGLKGRKARLLSKFLTDSDNKVEECRLIADFVKMDIDSSSNSHDPIARQNVLKSKFNHESLQVQKEGVSSQLAKLQIDGMRDTFEMKIRTSSFFNTDKDLIRRMTGMTVVTDKEIKKLNALSNSQVFQDSQGNWIGGNEAMVSLMNGLGLHRA